ncbi:MULTISPECIES: glycosyltransferase [unclassified Pseudoclavibacter]|uniref:glycosyltransferase n=1 Tax=unclassified Pseudoclavibacter TaxID=2615177 RepID=UPI0012EF15C2|nr:MULTISPECIES: glycosyltransferase [unclassified Pseudoclavibacter]MBF4457672.1 glycosyltransferase [Pseudoclavibacter sp. VKM Ac-2867]VXB05128.1 Glycosyltransferase family 4 protein [Pseudoclavibacter sp. 8L]
MRICVIGPSRFPISEPFAGGLESHTHALILALKRRGHEVTLFAAPGSDPALGVEHLSVESFTMSETARQDVGAMPVEWMHEHHAYLALMLDLAQTAKARFDAVLNVSIHHLPVAMSGLLGVPFFTTLHTPPVGWIESAVRISGSTGTFIAVSSHMRDAWAGSIESTVILNGVDTDRLLPGPGGGAAFWSGRIVPEKGLDLAIAAAELAQVDLDIAGPIFDPEYFERSIRPRLGGRIRYLGHLEQATLFEHLGRASVTLVTPRWDEPYGLVAAESLAAGTPVAAFDRGALPQIIDKRSGRLAARDDVPALAAALLEAARLPREGARERAVAFCSLERMVDEYEALLGGAQSERQEAA